jgi:hypothetical protein
MLPRVWKHLSRGTQFIFDLIIFVLFLAVLATIDYEFQMLVCSFAGRLR